MSNSSKERGKREENIIVMKGKKEIRHFPNIV